LFQIERVTTIALGEISHEAREKVGLQKEAEV